MKNAKSATFLLMILVGFSGCEENFVARQQPAASLDKTVLDRRPEGMDGYTDHPNGQRVAYPTIIKQTYIPGNYLFAHTKCDAWRITWPPYAAGTDQDKIPTVFSTLTGGLNSFYYLNNTAATNTYKAHFNLYYDTRLEAANSLWDELDYTFEASGEMDWVNFSKANFSVKSIEYMAKERPSQFEAHWPGHGTTELDYQEGDFFLFNIHKNTPYKNLYGGIRIASMNPRIIEVYLAVPN